MACQTHEKHEHQHGAGCGHAAIRHEGQTSYLHGGHLHRHHEGHVDEDRVAIGGANPANCTPNHKCDAHDGGHRHGPNCGHEAVPHGDHVDYLVGGHIHHPHGGHCDDHGPIQAIAH